MKYVPLALLLSLAFLLPTTMHGQDEMPKKTRLGFGVSFSPTRLGQETYYVFYQSGLEVTTSASVPIQFYLPIDFNERFRLEPSFGVNSFNTETSSSSTSPGSTPTTTSSSGSVVSLGLRGFYLSPVSTSLAMYVGPQFGLDFVSSKSAYDNVNTFPTVTKVTYTTEISETDLRLGAVFGAEYSPISQFSVGAEFSFNYVSYGNPDRTRTVTPPPPPATYTTTSERKQHTFRTDALFFLRWFFLQSAN